MSRLLLMADSDGDGFIDLGEFMELNTRDVDDAAALEDLREAFAVFDVNGDASISAEELNGDGILLIDVQSNHLYMVNNYINHLSRRLFTDRHGRTPSGGTPSESPFPDYSGFGQKSRVLRRETMRDPERRRWRSPQQDTTTGGAFRSRKQNSSPSRPDGSGDDGPNNGRKIWVSKVLPRSD
ncbi:putative calcium-binding protein CML25 [Acorus gramineus]|uniref:Calcium-binding protein CML25 n=1 Tax=Acorus gramineus TaxID=55184 RepID=A0AAV8ZW89_ACOGR|nr:putative calcium-binding protein CML25 [Acorus gramineus]